MGLFEITQETIRPIDRTTFEAAGLRERADLQRLLRDHINVIADDVLIISEEFGDWEESRRRIDLLGVHSSGNLVVIELKRTEDGGHMELQAIRYASMVAAMTFDQAVETFRAYLERRGREDDPRDAILSFLCWEEPNEEDFAQEVRILLVSADFSKELTTAVLWLNERGLDIRCVRARPYADSSRVLLDVQQVIPLPEAEGYQVRLREKAVSERSSRAGQSERDHRYLRFWTELLPKAAQESDLHRDISPAAANWVAASKDGLTFCYVIARSRARIELYLGSPNAAENLALFEHLLARKAEIETAFRDDLVWQDLSGKKACRIAYWVPGSNFEDEASWGEIQDRMIEAMGRLEAALRPHTQAYRKGE